MANYCWTSKQQLPDPANGTTFENTNFSQMEPHTEIFAGKTGLIFNNCNLINCDVPADSTINSGIHCHKSWCSNLHPKFIESGLPECEANCDHVIDTETITIDGVLVDTIYTYSDTGVE